MIPLDPQVVHRLGWALVHFVWQGAAMALVVAATPALLHRRSWEHTTPTPTRPAPLAATAEKNSGNSG
jgi:hypothetical protein